MNLIEILSSDCTLCAVEATSKKRVLETICKTAADKLPDFSTYELLESLVAREKMGSTGIGNGIAIPHGRLANTEKAIAVLITTHEAIEFDAVDNRPVDIFVALFVPEEQCQQHLTTLQSIAKMLSDKAVCKSIRKCESNEELHQFITRASSV